jgi:predicted ATP-dependent serine protease
MLAGAPGAGKTWLALDLATRMNIPALYISADSDDITMRIRVASMLTGHDQRTVREVSDHGLFKEVYGDIVADLPIRFLFEPSEPSMEDIRHELEAYQELNGQMPQLIIVDNLINLESDNANEWAGIRMAAKDLHYLCRKTKACIVALHHTSEQDPRWISGAPPRSAIQGKISQLQSLIITVGKDENIMWLAVVKNRFGEADPGAVGPFRFVVDLARGKIWESTLQKPGVVVNGYARV